MIINTAGKVRISLIEVGLTAGKAAAILASAGATAAPDITVNKDSDKIVGLSILLISLPDFLESKQLHM
jgi:hypothetical protein